LIEVLSKNLNISTKEKPQKRKGFYFSIVPVTTTAGGKRILVSSINIAFRLGKEDSTNFSSIFFLPYTNFSDNIGFGLKLNLFTSKNIWNLPGEIRISKIGQFTYGLGSLSTEAQQTNLQYNNLRVYLNANRKLAGNYFAGMGFDYDNYYDIQSTPAGNNENQFEKYGIGTNSSTAALGINFNLLYDNRKNSINPTDGCYAAFIYRVNPLTTNAQWTSVYFDARRYFRLPSIKRKIMALSAFYWGTDGKVPYLNLPGTQLEFTGRSGRGYSVGRFRGKQMLYLEGEYRFDISKNRLWGGVLFLNAQSLSDSDNNFTAINPAGGFGARIKFNKTSETNLTLDFGFGKDSFGFYIGLGEFF
jgi:outer membrane protein assembly factor BamA